MPSCQAAKLPSCQAAKLPSCHVGSILLLVSFDEVVQLEIVDRGRLNFYYLVVDELKVMEEMFVGSDPNPFFLYIARIASTCVERTVHAGSGKLVIQVQGDIFKWKFRECFMLRKSPANVTIAPEHESNPDHIKYLSATQDKRA